LTNAKNGFAPLFTTNAEGLFEAYLSAMPESDRQYHTCHACRNFIERFGGLVTIDEKGMTAPAVWNEEDAPDVYRGAVAALARIVRRAKVTGVFMSSEKVWGLPVTGIWHHLALKPPVVMLFKGAILTAGQAMAEKREDFKNIITAINEFTLPMIEQALTLLNTDSLYRSEKVIGPAQWLHDLHVARDAAGASRANVVWRAIATAPAGFCHPRSSMIGTLLEDIATGTDFSDASRKFAAKMHPVSYQRPQAAPSAANIAQAEKVIAQLGAAGSLARRFARLEEMEAIWKPKPKAEEPQTGGVFGHLKPKESAEIAPMKVPPVTMTWDKFFRTVIPTAEGIEFYAQPGRDSYTALVTAVNADAPPILQWDREEKRNPVSWYVWHGGSAPQDFSLSAGKFHKIAAVTFKPSMWGDVDSNAHQGQAVIFIIEGARETKQAGAAIFPETLKAEFHGIRATIEAYSRNASIEGMETSTACGIMLDKGSNWSALFRVTVSGKTVDYQLDRWD
jgi:hypothetical protein